MAKTQRAESQPVVKNFTPYKIKKGEPYMSDKQRDHFKKILLGWRNQLMEEVDRTMHHLQDDAANYADPADRATQEEEFSLELRTRDRERKLIKKIADDPFAIEDIKNPSEQMQLVAVKQNGAYLEYIKNPSEKVQLAAVTQNGDAIKHIKNPSPSVLALSQRD